MPNLDQLSDEDLNKLILQKAKGSAPVDYSSMSDEELDRHIKNKQNAAAPQSSPGFFDRNPTIKGLVRGGLETLPMIGAIGGGAIGAGAGAAETAGTLGAAAPTIPLQAVAGAGLGAAGGKSLENLGKHYILGEKMDEPSEQLKGIGKEGLLGATAEGTGQIIGQAGKAIKGLGTKTESAIADGELNPEVVSRLEDYKSKFKFPSKINSAEKYLDSLISKAKSTPLNSLSEGELKAITDRIGPESISKVSEAGSSIGNGASNLMSKAKDVGSSAIDTAKTIGSGIKTAAKVVAPVFGYKHGGAEGALAAGLLTPHALDAAIQTGKVSKDVLTDMLQTPAGRQILSRGLLTPLTEEQTKP